MPCSIANYQELVVVIIISIILWQIRDIYTVYLFHQKILAALHVHSLVNASTRDTKNASCKILIGMLEMHTPQLRSSPFMIIRTQTLVAR